MVLTLSQWVGCFAMGVRGHFSGDFGCFVFNHSWWLMAPYLAFLSSVVCCSYLQNTSLIYIGFCFKLFPTKKKINWPVMASMILTLDCLNPVMASKILTYD